MDPFDLQRDRENSYGPFATNILLIRVDVMPQVPDRPLRQLVFTVLFLLYFFDRQNNKHTTVICREKRTSARF